MNSQLENDTDFLRKIYVYSFRFLLEEGSRTIPKELATDYWKLLIHDKFGEKSEKWCQFVDQKWEYAINRDQWNMLFNFMVEWEAAQSLDFYDEMAAWPSIIDEFVEYLSETKGGSR